MKKTISILVAAMIAMTSFQVQAGTMKKLLVLGAVGTLGYKGYQKYKETHPDFKIPTIQPNSNANTSANNQPQYKIYVDEYGNPIQQPSQPYNYQQPSQY